MTDYKWIRNSEEKICLADENFKIFNWKETGKLNSLVIQTLESSGIEVGIKKDNIFSLRPKEVKEIEITAPLYSCARELISDYYTAKTVSPEQYAWVIQTYEEVKEKVKKEQEKLFEEMYKYASYDKGITAAITFRDNEESGNVAKFDDDIFLEEYIPKWKYVIIAKSYSSKSHKKIYVFMRKVNAGNQRILIRVPNKLVGLVYGRKKYNTRAIKAITNASKVEVEKVDSKIKV